MSSAAEPRDGAVGFYNELKEFLWANPRDALYSTLSMVATHFYSDGEWKKIFED